MLYKQPQAAALHLMAADQDSGDPLPLTQRCAAVGVGGQARHQVSGSQSAGGLENVPCRVARRGRPVIPLRLLNMH